MRYIVYEGNTDIMSTKISERLPRGTTEKRTVHRHELLSLIIRIKITTVFYVFNNVKKPDGHEDQVCING